jgi:diguanylate cyclase
MFVTTKPNTPADSSHSLCRTALAQLNEHGIPPSPPHYCVWYHYASGSPAALKAELDQMLAQSGPVSPASSMQLYERHFGTEAEAKAIEKIGADLTQALNDIGEQMTNAGEGARQFADALQIADGSLTELGENSNVSVQEIISGLIRATGEMVARNRELEESLQSSSTQVAALQSRLNQVRAEALTDGLTGIANRRCFDMRLHDHLRQAREDGTELSVMLVDIDHFKSFNDTYGHKIGDQVLKVVAFALRSAAIGDELPARYGGEEFAILMPGLTAEMALQRAERLRLNLANQYLRHKPTGENFGRITVSIGVAGHQSEETADILVSRADQALYRAKREGRNRVVIDGQAQRATAVPPRTLIELSDRDAG